MESSFLIGFALFIIAIVVLIVASIWKLYEKAGEPGWAAIIPIYGQLVMIKIAGKPWWWLLLSGIPYIGPIWGIWTLNLFIKKFGKTEGYTIGCIFLPFIFFPVLAFSSDTRFEDGLEDTIKLW